MTIQDTAARLTGGTSFLKWVGGKTRYAKALASIAPDYSGTYREPFMGSAAMFFEMAPDEAVLSDLNAEVVHAFQQVQVNPDAVTAALDSMVNSKDYYLTVRAQDVADLTAVARAARLIYLNKTSFRGLWRVNRKGHMNTPYGAYDRPLYNAATIRACHKALAGVEIRHEDFQAAIDAAEDGDFVYLDPPYIPLGGWADFQRYTPQQFNLEDHARLADAMRRADQRGVLLLMSNSDTKLTREVYAGFHMDTMNTRRDINLVAGGRASTDLLVSNYQMRPRLLLG